MQTILSESLFFGVIISLVGYEIGLLIKRKFKKNYLNPLLISILFVIGFLIWTDVSYDCYYEGAKYISYLLTPATVCLAIPLYEQWMLLKQYKEIILIGIFSGVLASLGSIFLFSILFGLSHQEYVTLLPKSITTAIGMTVSTELNGIPTITVAVIIITGILGNIIGETILKLFNIHESIAKGLALGTAAHAIGTTKALEIGEIEGAMSSLSIVVAGLLTVILAPIFATFL